MEDIQEYVKSLLSGRIFLGEYKERRYVDRLQEYRDVVVINGAEANLVQDLEKIRDKFRKHLNLYSWIAITYPDFPGAPVGYCFWVQLTDIPFGHYWFQLKTVKITQQEISFRLKVIRYLNPSEAEVLLNKSHTTEGPKKEEPSAASVGPDITELNETFVKPLLENMKQMFQNVTPANTFLTLKLIIALVFTFIYYGITFIGLVGEYFLKFLHEVSHFIHVSTPLFLSIIDALSKCVGGLYLLLAMMWRDFFNPQAPKPQQNLPSLTYGNLGSSRKPKRQSRDDFLYSNKQY